MALNIFAMPSSSLVLLLSAAFGFSSALPWAGPEPTKVYEADEWSPRPTNTAAVDPRELFGRVHVDVSFCGWLGGNSADPAVCPSGSSCIRDISHGAVGCCARNGPCTEGVYTSCVDENSGGKNSGPVVVNNGIYTCPVNSFCYKNTYPGNYYQWGCGSSDQATTVETSYSGQATDVKLQIVYTGINFTPTTITKASTTSSSVTSDSSSSTSAASTTESSSEASTTSPAAESSTTDAMAGEGKSKASSGTNKGVIAAGVIGSSAFLIALAGIILFFLRRRQKQPKQQTGSFMSVMKGDGADSSNESVKGNFARVQPYGPDDFVSPLPTADSTRSRGYDDGIYDEDPQAASQDSYISPERQAYPTLDYPTLDNDVHPAAATPPSLTTFSPTQYIGIQERMAENADIPVPTSYYSSPPRLDDDGFPIVSEIDNFSTSFHKAIAQMSPPTPAQSQRMASLKTRDLTAHSSNPSQQPYPPIGASMGGGIGATVMGGIIGGSRNIGREPSISQGPMGMYSPIAGYPLEDTPPTAYPYDSDDDDDEDDDDDDLGSEAELKEMGVAQVGQVMSQPPGYTATARDDHNRDSWAPVELRPTREQMEQLSEETRRYQLVDRPPSQAPVLHAAGLRGQGRREKDKRESKDKSKGELEE